MWTRLVPFLLLGLAAVVAAGSLSRPPAPVRHAHAVPEQRFNPTDVAWVQLMIPMGERALPLLDLGAEQGHDPGTRRLASRLRTEHTAELARLRGLLREAGLSEANPHAGHDMPGMATVADLARLRGSEGPDFDRLFAEHLRAHLRQSLSVTRSVQVSGADPAVRTVAAGIERGREAQLSALSTEERSPS